MPKDISRNRLDLLVDITALDGKIEVLDIGANPIEGEVSYQALLDSGYANVTGFEPQEEALAALDARKSDAETYLPHALGDGKKKNLHIYQSSGFTSIFPADAASAAYLSFEKGMTEKQVIPMPTRRLDILKLMVQPCNARARNTGQSSGFGNIYGVRIKTRLISAADLHRTGNI